MTIRALVFDLAGVLLDFGGPESLHTLALDIPPNQIAFFDDSAKCVNGAIAVGMHAQHVTGFGDLRVQLNRMGILDKRSLNAMSFGETGPTNVATGWPSCQ